MLLKFDLGALMPLFLSNSFIQVMFIFFNKRVLVHLNELNIINNQHQKSEIQLKFTIQILYKNL